MNSDINGNETMIKDVPSPIDLRRMSDAEEWESLAMIRRPWRTEFFAELTAQLIASKKPIHRVLELGSGPGFLALQLLTEFPNISYVALDFSPAMHELARKRLGDLASRASFVERSFLDDDWGADLVRFDCVVTHQAVHELRHKRRAPRLHAQVKAMLVAEGMYLMCDHYAGEDGMANDQLYMNVDEHEAALVMGGFADVKPVMRQRGLILYRSIA